MSTWPESTLQAFSQTGFLPQVAVRLRTWLLALVVNLSLSPPCPLFVRWTGHILLAGGQQVPTCWFAMPCLMQLDRSRGVFDKDTKSLQEGAQD